MSHFSSSEPESYLYFITIFNEFFHLFHFNNKVIGIESTGYSGKKATIDFYRSKGFKKIPNRGSLSALTVPGAVSGWQRAYDYSNNYLGGNKSLSEIFDSAIQIANSGFSVTKNLERNLIFQKYHLQLTFLPHYQIDFLVH